MEPFTTLTGAAAPLMRPDVNTDIIIRIERPITYGRDELGPFAFESWRYHPDGSENPAFVLNQPPYRNARILLNGPNFGCGSSRETAVWAIKAFGIRCVIAPSFGDIFFGNCFQNGVLPITLPIETVESLAVEAGDGAFTVDLTRNRIVAPFGREVAFEVDPGRREMLLSGLDEVGVTLRRETEIAAFQAQDRAERPWIWEIA